MRFPYFRYPYICPVCGREHLTWDAAEVCRERRERASEGKAVRDYDREESR